MSATTTPDTPSETAAATAVAATAPAAGAAPAAEAHKEVPLSQQPDVQASIKAKLDTIPAANYVITDVTYGFRAAEKGGPKRPSVKLAIPLPTINGISDALTEGPNAEKVQQWLVSLVSDAVIAQAREQVNDSVKPVSSQSELDLSKLTMEAIALMPKSERGGPGIAKEVWESFSTDYTSIMLNEGLQAPKVAKAVELFVKRLQPCKTNKTVLKKLKEYLDLWFTKSTSQEELQEVYEYLTSKCDTYMNADDQELANLL